jgi:hypothetical protein
MTGELELLLLHGIRKPIFALSAAGTAQIPPWFGASPIGRCDRWAAPCRRGSARATSWRRAAGVDSWSTMAADDRYLPKARTAQGRVARFGGDGG